MSIFDLVKIDKNQLELERGSHIVVSTFHGKQHVKELEEIAAQMQEKLSYLRRAKEPGRLLIDLTDIEKMDTPCRKVVIKSMQGLDYDKLAIFGGTALIGAIAKFLIFVSGKQDKIHYFDDEKSARDWLEE